jgi:hypothetical protein
MPNNASSRTRQKAVRTYFLSKRIGGAACIAAALMGGLAYFREDLPLPDFSAAGSRVTERGIPEGSILIPYDDGLCRLHALDNATGQIQDGGLVNCRDASDRNSAAWKSMVDQLKATQIRKSFRHD